MYDSPFSTSLLFGGAESRCCLGRSSRRGRGSRPDEGMQSFALAEVRAESGSAGAVGSIPPRRCSGEIEGSACEMAMGAPTSKPLVQSHVGGGGDSLPLPFPFPFFPLPFPLVIG